MSVVVEICELVGPLSHDAQRVFEKGHDNQEAANCWEITVAKVRISLLVLLRRACSTTTSQSHGRVPPRDWRPHLRLGGVRDSVQHVLELARLGPQLVEGTGIVAHVVVAPGVAKGALVAQMVASCAAYLCHGWECSRGGKRMCEAEE